MTKIQVYMKLTADDIQFCSFTAVKKRKRVKNIFFLLFKSKNKILIESLNF